MSLIDILKASEARRRGDFNTELNIISKIVDNTEIAPIANEIVKTGIMSKLAGSAKKSIIGISIAASLGLGSVSTASAQNYVPVGKSANVLTQHKQLKYLTDYVAGLYTTDIAAKDRARDALYRLAIHESGDLVHRRQVVERGGKFLEAGPAHSIFGVELDIAEAMVDWASTRPRAMRVLTKTSGLSAKQLQSLNQDRLANLLMSNDKFAAGIARVKLLSRPGELPSKLADQAKYTAKNYYVGKLEGRAALQKNYAKQYVADNIRFSKRVSQAMLNQQTTRSKGGTATTKAVKTMLKFKPR
jgi:hypothetical protein